MDALAIRLPSFLAFLNVGYVTLSHDVRKRLLRTRHGRLRSLPGVIQSRSLVRWPGCAAFWVQSLSLALVLGVAPAQATSLCPQSFKSPVLFQLKPAALSSLASSGCVNAQVALGLDYIYGRGVDRDPVRALSWLRRAASAGDVYAQYTVADLYASGQGVDRSWSRAAYWYRRAAEQGSAYAQARLGALYAAGRGVVRDRVSALMWLQLAAPSEPDAAKRLKRLRARATSRQRHLAQERAKTWDRRHGNN